jgi:hypothetical protein
MTLSNQTKAYGETDPIGYASTSGATLTSIVAGVGGNNTFAVTTADVLAGLTGGRAAGENVGSYAYSLSASSFNTTFTAQPNLVIGKRDITLATLVAPPKVYDGSTLATITSGTFGNLFNGETLLISGQGLFSTKDVANGKTVTVADVSTLTKANGTGNWSNYSLTTTSKTTNANITRKDVTLDGITAAHKVYDGNNTASITAGVINTGVGTETLAISGSGSFSDANAADGKTVTVTNCGRICLDGKKIHFSTVFAGHDVGLRQVEEDVWLVSFMDYDMAYFDMESSRVQALENPFGPKVLGM